jgi:SAM-dependent methyltransferase
MNVLDQKVAVHLELPLFRPEQHEFLVQGWIASDLEIRQIGVHGAGHAFSRSPRPDVERAFVGRQYCDGFCGLVRQADLHAGVLRLDLDVAGRPEVRTFTLDEPPEPLTRSRQHKAALLFPSLICPECGSGLSGEAPPARTPLICSGCAEEYDRTQDFFDLLPPRAREEFRLRDGVPISLVPYDPRAQELIDSLPEGLILDCGAGYRLKEPENVVHLEVASYPSTHVRALNERLPFRDGTFDAVISLAVLEHVRDPFASARELYRVLKPGGTLLCIVPLMSPVHGYPDHYYNMTATGVRNLFPAELVTVEQSVPPSGRPVFWLTWSLRQWVDQLPRSARERFVRMRIRDLLDEGTAYLEEDFVKQLPDAANFDLAATTLLLGKKPLSRPASTSVAT